MRWILSLIAAAVGIALLIRPAAVSAAVMEGITSCLEVIVPSLFAFTVLAVYLQNSGLYRTVLRPLTLPLSKLLRTDEELCAVFILGNIGGYPVGARLLTQLVQQNRLSSKHASRLLCCCYGSGPSFIISIAGMRIFGSAAAGAALFAACFISSLLIAIFVFRTGERIVLASADTKYDLGSACFVSSVMSAARVMYTVCAMIIGFSAVTAVLDIAGVASAAAKLIGSDAVFSSIMEISRVQSLPLKDFTMPICAALLSFGGVCVILQICALTADSLQMRGFLLSRLPAAIFSAVFAVLFSKLLPEGWLTSPQTHQVYAPTGAETQLFSVNAGMSVCVLIMCGLLLLGAQKKSCD